MRGISILIIVVLALACCSSEKVTLSPVYESLASSKGSASGYTPRAFTEKTGQVFYAGELTSLVSSFPKFENSALNKEVKALKYHVKEYVYAVESYNLVGQETAMRNIEKSYKKIQKLRKYLSVNDDEVVNRYLVRMKSNLSQLEAHAQDSLK